MDYFQLFTKKCALVHFPLNTRGLWLTVNEKGKQMNTFKVNIQLRCMMTKSFVCCFM